MGNIPRGAAFNPNAESPSIRKTAGFDHTRSGAVKDPSVKTEAVAPQPEARGMGGFKMGNNNRGAFKRPSMTGHRPGDQGLGGQGQERTVLRDMPANASMVGQQQHLRQPSNEPDVKRPRLSGP